jgi:hypothetical protein
MAYPGFEPGPLAQKSDVLTTVLSGHLMESLKSAITFELSDTETHILAFWKGLFQKSVKKMDFFFGQNEVLYVSN